MECLFVCLFCWSLGFVSFLFFFVYFLCVYIAAWLSVSCLLESLCCSSVGKYCNLVLHVRFGLNILFVWSDIDGPPIANRGNETRSTKHVVSFFCYRVMDFLHERSTKSAADVKSLWVSKMAVADVLPVITANSSAVGNSKSRGSFLYPYIYGR